LEQGRDLSDLEPTWRALAHQVALPALRCVLAMLYCELGHLSDARDELARFAEDDFASVPNDVNRPSSLALLSNVAVTLGDEASMTALYERSTPYAGEHLTNGTFYYFGMMDHHLGVLAAKLGRPADAAAHFEAALRGERRAGARCWIARTQYSHAELLLAQGDPRSRARGAKLLEDSVARARRIGMEGLVAKAERLQLEIEGTAPVQPVPPPSRYLLRRRGDFWSVAFDGNGFEIKDQKGVAFLAHLLRQPGRRIHVLELAAAVEPARSESGSAEGLEMLDGRAIREYRGRLKDLRDELAEAEAANDVGRRGQLAAEIEFVQDEIASAVGLGGRLRKTGGASERARLNVTRAIQGARRNIERHSEALATHLDRALHTGTYCSYDPDPAAGVVWET
jgi:hypothetical protein